MAVTLRESAVDNQPPKNSTQLPSQKAGLRSITPMMNALSPSPLISTQSLSWVFAKFAAAGRQMARAS
jgi:hypothetical protein